MCCFFPLTIFGISGSTKNVHLSKISLAVDALVCHFLLVLVSDFYGPISFVIGF